MGEGEAGGKQQAQHVEQSVVWKNWNEHSAGWKDSLLLL